MKHASTIGSVPSVLQKHSFIEILTGEAVTGNGPALEVQQGRYRSRKEEAVHSNGRLVLQELKILLSFGIDCIAMNTDVIRFDMILHRGIDGISPVASLDAERVSLSK